MRVSFAFSGYATPWRSLSSRRRHTRYISVTGVQTCALPILEALRAYGKWLDCQGQLPEFAPAPGGGYYKHPVLGLEVARQSCPHLLEHDCYNGYYLPCEFERLAQVEPYKILGHWPATRSVGS